MGASYAWAFALLSAVVIGVVVLGFVQTKVMEVTPRLGQRTFELLPNGNDQVLCRRQDPFHPRHVQVEILVVERVFHVNFDEVTQIFQVHAVPRFRGGLTLDGDMQFIIVAVPIGIGAFSEDFEVLLVGPIVVP